MIKHITTLLFVIVGLINFTPLIGVIGQARLESLYGIEITSPDMLLLLRHRAVLFGIVGGYILVAALKPALRNSASIMGYLSMISYVVLVNIGPATNAHIDRVMQIDLVAILLLTGAVIFDRKQHRT